MRHPWFLPALSVALAAQAPIQVGQPLPELLDLSQVETALLVPEDARNPAQVEAAHRAWTPLIASLKPFPSLRLRLPRDERRLPVLLAASQELKAQNPDQRLLLAFEAGAPPLWDERAWGALDGGVIAPEDLGADPAGWRDLLAKAQEQLPGRPWTLWFLQDPGPWTAPLLGDGARLAVPREGPAARLAAVLPRDFREPQGNPGDLTLRDPVSGEVKRWRFSDGAWTSVEPSLDRQAVAVVAAAAYDVHALLAKMRATQLRDRGAIRTQTARLEVELHLQAERGVGTDLGFTFQSYEQAGESQEVLQREVRFNGVKANLKGQVQLPVIEPRATLAPPVALELTERYRYSDGGPAGPGQRFVHFGPAEQDPLLFEGELRVEEGTGRILEERSSRSGLPGVVKSERRTLVYGETAPGYWGLLRMGAHERWATPDGVTQVQRRMVYSEFRINAPEFDAERQAARTSQDTMLKQTVEGVRYYVRQEDGSRRVEERMKQSGKGLGVLLLADPRMNPSIFPAAGLAYFNFDAFGKGVQINALTAGVFNTISVMVPSLPLKLDLAVNSTAMLLPVSERPVVAGKLADRDAVDRRFFHSRFTLGRDLGAGFRLEGAALFDYNRFQRTKDEDHETLDFAVPPSGWRKGWQGTLCWQFRGFQVKAIRGGGRRPSGTYGFGQSIPDAGRFRYWGGSLAFDRRTSGGWMMHGEMGRYAGHGFDRFLQLGAEAQVGGVDTAAVPSDRTDFGKVAVSLPPIPALRLTFSLSHARLRALDDGRIYDFTGLGVTGDLPGFGWFTTVSVDLNAGLQSDVRGLKHVQGHVALLRVF